MKIQGNWLSPNKLAESVFDPPSARIVDSSGYMSNEQLATMVISAGQALAEHRAEQFPDSFYEGHETDPIYNKYMDELEGATIAKDIASDVHAELSRAQKAQKDHEASIAAKALEDQEALAEAHRILKERKSQSKVDTTQQASSN